MLILADALSILEVLGCKQTHSDNWFFPITPQPPRQPTAVTPPQRGI